MLNWLENFDAALGHGRRTELLFAVIALMTANSLFHESAIAESATYHVLRDVDPRVVGLPWLAYGLATLYGLLANIYEWPLSRYARILGAGLGLALWMWVTLLHRSTLTETMLDFSIPGMIFSAMIARSAVRDLPPPGFPGLWR